MNNANASSNKYGQLKIITCTISFRFYKNILFWYVDIRKIVVNDFTRINSTLVKAFSLEHVLFNLEIGYIF